MRSRPRYTSALVRGRGELGNPVAAIIDLNVMAKPSQPIPLRAPYALAGETAHAEGEDDTNGSFAPMPGCGTLSPSRCTAAIKEPHPP